MSSNPAYSIYERPDGYHFAYKVLGRAKNATPLVMVHGCVRREGLQLVCAD